MKLTDEELKRISHWFELSSDQLGDDDLKIFDKINEELEGADDGPVDTDEEVFYFYDDSDDD